MEEGVNVGPGLIPLIMFGSRKAGREGGGALCWPRFSREQVGVRKAGERGRGGVLALVFP